MKVDYIVSRIEPSHDGAPYVYITYSNSGDFEGGTDKTPPECPFGPNITTTEDLMRNLPKAMANIGEAMGGGVPTDSPTFKISMREYEDMTIKVGDKVMIEIKKSNSTGV